MDIGGDGIDPYKFYFDLVASASHRSREWRIAHLDRLEKLITGAIASVGVADDRELARLADEVLRLNYLVAAQIPEREEGLEPVLKKEEIVHKKTT